jgi:glycosyltransferase involved in cell wall biosynthesis
MNKKILIVSIAKIDSVVIESIEKETCQNCDELFIYPKPARVSDLKRHLDCFLMAVKTIKKRKDYDSIIFWQQFIGLYYNVLCKLLLIRKFPKSIILTIIYIKRFGFSGKLYHWFYKSAFRSKYISKLICHSSSERKYYLEEFGNDLVNKIIFCKLGEGIILPRDAKTNGERYYFSGGSSNRDYKTLIKAFDGTNEKLIIACKPENVADINVPENVKIVFNTYDDGFSNLMKNSYSVILPIADPTISSGQLVLLNSMKYAKSTIVTTGNCMADYIDKSYALEVEAKSVEDLRKAVALLSTNSKLNEFMSENAYNHYCYSYSIDKYGKRIGQIINEI